MVFFGQEVLEELLKLIDRTCAAAKNFHREERTRLDKAARAKKKSENDILRELNKAVEAVGKAVKRSKRPNTAVQIKVWLLMREAQELATVRSLARPEDVETDLSVKYKTLHDKLTTIGARLHTWPRIPEWPSLSHDGAVLATPEMAEAVWERRKQIVGGDAAELAAAKVNSKQQGKTNGFLLGCIHWWEEESWNESG